MPQAPDYLRAKFAHDGEAWAALGDNFTDTRGLIRPKPGHKPTDREFDAIDYLVMEWDYAWEPAAVAAGVSTSAHESPAHGEIPK